MADVQANGAAKRGRAKKGEEMYMILFTDAENKDHTRVPANVQSLKIIDKAKKEKSFALSSLPPTILQQLAAMGLRRHADTYIRNGIDGNASNTLALATAVVDEVKAGKLYRAKEGGGPGRSFDFDFYVEVAQITADLKKKPATQKQLDALKAKLQGMKPDERTAKIKAWKTDAVYALAFKQAETKRAQVAAKSAKKEGTTDALADMF